MSSTKVINLGNTCSTFGFNAPNVLPIVGTGGTLYKTTIAGVDSYLMFQATGNPLLCNLASALIPATVTFNYNMFNIGLMWDSNIPAIGSYLKGDPRLRILTSYWNENPPAGGPTQLSTSATANWTIVSLTNPSSPADGFTVLRLPTTYSQTINGTGWSGLTVNSSFTKSSTTIFTSAVTGPAYNPFTYYLTQYSGTRTADATSAKNVYNTNLDPVDINLALLNPVFATLVVPSLSYSTFSTTSFVNNSHINYNGSNFLPGLSGSTIAAVMGAATNNSLMTNITVGGFSLMNGTTILSNTSSVDLAGKTAYPQSSAPAPDPDPAFTPASENGIIFQPLYPSVSGLTNPVLGVTNPATPSFAINSYFSFTPTGTPASFGYLLTYPLNYEEANPSIEAGSDFLLLTPDSAYIVYVNSAGLLATQTSNRLTSPGTSPNITFQTFGGYWKATAVTGGSPGVRGFQLAYVTATTTQYIIFNSVGQILPSTTTGGCTFTCMHCSPWAGTFICQPGL